MEQPYQDPFTAPGRWYRGNLHTHTSNSDGRLSPQEAVDWYRQQGYDFLSLTDHDCLTEVDSLGGPGFLLLPGQEAHPGRPELDDCYHLVALGLAHPHVFSSDHSVQAAIDELREDGALVFLAHPYWSGLTLPEMIGLQGLSGLEVFNATCMLMAKGPSSVHWDDLLARGQWLWGLATDDAHWGREDYGRAWIMVRAPELTRAAIMQALATGCFYASQGPEVYDLQVTAEEVHVRCSPASVINCVSLVGTGSRASALEGGLLLTEATFPRRNLQRYVRVECIDPQGRTAWTPPVRL